jgi:germination protein M
LDDQIESAVGSEPCELPETGDRVEEMMDLLLAGPTSEELVSPFPEGVTLKNWSVEDGVLKLNLSEQYNSLSGIGLTIADYCITLTMCQLPKINTVIISVEGELISFRDHQTLRVSDVLLSASDEEDGNITVD